MVEVVGQGLASGETGGYSSLAFRKRVGALAERLASLLSDEERATFEAYLLSAWSALERGERQSAEQGLTRAEVYLTMRSETTQADGQRRLCRLHRVPTFKAYALFIPALPRIHREKRGTL